MDKYANRIGLFGGTFDPIHNAHIEMAKIAQQRFNLDIVYFIVAKDPPFKEHVTLDAEKRLQLVTKALENDTQLKPSSVELDRAGTSYSYLTVQDFKQQFPQAELFWIMGVDAFNTLAEWKEFEFLKSNLQFIVFNRSEKINLQMKDLKVFYINDFDLEISSTQMRELSKQGTVSKDIPENIRAIVLDYYRKS